MRTYSARQARFVAACREHIPGVRALGIEAGLHVVLTFGARVDDQALAARLAGAGLACSAAVRVLRGAGGGRADRPGLRLLPAAGDQRRRRRPPDRPAVARQRRPPLS